MKKDIVIAALLLALGIMIGVLLGARRQVVPSTAEHKTDTLIVIDTHIIEKPVMVERTYRDSFYIAIRDTICVRDSIYISLPREVKVYEDSLYHAEVSGYMPSLDLIEVYAPTRILTMTETIRLPERKRWGIGIQAGYGVGLQNKTIIHSPYIGIGISYNLITF